SSPVEPEQGCLQRLHHRVGRRPIARRRQPEPAVVMAIRPERSRAGRPPAISRQQLVQMAIRIGDAEGLEAVSLRRLGEELGVSPMAFYRHLGSKDHLFDEMLDLLAAGVDTSWA